MTSRKQKKETVQPVDTADRGPTPSVSSEKLTLGSCLSGAASPANIEISEGNMIMKAIEDLKKELSGNIESVLRAVDGVKRDVSEFSNRLTEAEQRIGNTEDTVSTLEKTVATLQKQVDFLRAKAEDQENRSRRNNLRLINLPEGAEGRDAASFLERWLPEVLGTDTFPYPLFIERAHCLQGRQDRNFPRPLIMRFLNFKDKERAMQAARAKGKVVFEEREVKFFHDVAKETHIKRRRFDEVKQQLKTLNVQYGIIHPARLRVTHAGHSRVFDNPEDAAVFARGLSAGPSD